MVVVVVVVVVAVSFLLIVPLPSAPPVHSPSDAASGKPMKSMMRSRVLRNDGPMRRPTMSIEGSNSQTSMSVRND